MSQSTHPQLTDALRRLDALTDWERRPRNAMRVGLDPMRDLMDRLGNPHEGFRCIHVAGTKGKGSVCALAEAALWRAGWSVGRYASPHVQHVTERINILGRPVQEQAMALSLLCALDACEAARRAGTPGADATWFDVMTAAAFLLFKEADLDWVVLETGLGGRKDSTNVVNAEMAVITNVELEHTEVLGAARDLIAREKVGILKPGAVLATTLADNDPAGRVLQARADELRCPVIRVGFEKGATIAERNAGLVGLVLDELGRRGVRTRGEGGAERPIGAWLLDKETCEKACLPGRMERFEIDVRDARRDAVRTTPVILDGAHVPFNLDAVLNDLRRRQDLPSRCVAIVALAADKDAEGFLMVLSRTAAVAIFTTAPGHSRSHSPEHLNELARALGLRSEIEPDAVRAWERGVARASGMHAWVLVTGSLYLVGALRAGIGGRSIARL